MINRRGVFIIILNNPVTTNKEDAGILEGRTIMKEKSEIFLKLYSLLFGSGMAKDLRPVNCTTLLAIASFIDADGNCSPTQVHIAEVTGMSTTTVNKAVNALLEFKVNGKSIITREFVQQGQFTYSYYTFHLS